MADDLEEPKPVQEDSPESPRENDSQVEVSINYKPREDAAHSTIRPIKAIYDDFSLTSGAASGVRFRSHNRTREFKIYDQPNAQLILEEVEDRDDGDEEGQDEKMNRGIRIKRANDTSYGLQFLRATYSLIAVFVGGFLLILGICILLFLFIDLATQVKN